MSRLSPSCSSCEVPRQFVVAAALPLPPWRMERLSLSMQETTLAVHSPSRDEAEPCRREKQEASGSHSESRRLSAVPLKLSRWRSVA